MTSLHSDHSSVKVSWLSVVVGLLGVVVSAYALFVHIQNLLKPGGGALCDINATFNCSAVVSSSYGEFLSIPLGAYGISYFIIVIAAALAPKYAKLTPKQYSLLGVFIGSVGVLVALLLAYISYVKIGAVCPTCTITHALTIIYAVISGVSLFKVRTSHFGKLDIDGVLRFFAVAICLSLPPLAAGLISPVLVDYFATKEQTNEVSTTNKNTENKDNNSNYLNEEKPVAELLTFDKKNDYRLGSDNAPVIIQMFSDFGCPHCKKATEAVLQAQETVGLDKVLFVYRFFPLSSKCNPYVPSPGWYPYSCSLVVASRCAGKQGAFWQFKSWGFSGQEMTDQQRALSFSREGMVKQVQNLKLNSSQFLQCLDSGTEEKIIAADAALANRLNIEGTPLIYINGQQYSGPHFPAAFAQAFAMAAKKAN